MASPRVALRLTERVHGRVLEAAQREGLSVSGWVRRAILDRLEQAAKDSEAALLDEARRYVTAHPGAYESDLIDGYIRLLEAVAGRLSAAERHGRARAVAEIVGGALEPLDGEVITLAPYHAEMPVVLETTPPRRRGFLRLSLVEERARELLATPAAPGPPSQAGLFGERATRELFRQAISWGDTRSLFCRWHGVVPSAPNAPDRCYLGCRVETSGDGPEVA